MDKLEAIFKDKATKVFGSGWVWLVWYIPASVCLYPPTHPSCMHPVGTPQFAP